MSVIQITSELTASLIPYVKINNDGDSINLALDDQFEVRNFNLDTQFAIYHDNALVFEGSYADLTIPVPGAPGAQLLALNNIFFTTSTTGNFVVKNPNITPGTNTKITYDAKGLVTAGVAATTADINDSLNRRYVTDAQLLAIGVALNLKNSLDFDLIDHEFNGIGGSIITYNTDTGIGGSLTLVNNVTATNGVTRFTIGTNANSRARICGVNSNMLFFDAVKTGITFRFANNTLPAAADEYLIFLGLSEVATTAIQAQTNCVGFMQDRTNLTGLNGGLITNWVLVSKVGGTTNTVNTGVAVDTAWHNFTIESNSAVDGNLHFWMDGVDVGNFTPAQLPNFLTITTQLKPDIRLNRIGVAGLATKTLDLDFRRIYKTY